MRGVERRQDMMSAESEEKDENKEALVSDLHAKNNASTMTENSGLSFLFFLHDVARPPVLRCATYWEGLTSTCHLHDRLPVNFSVCGFRLAKKNKRS